MYNLMCWLATIRKWLLHWQCSINWLLHYITIEYVTLCYIQLVTTATLGVSYISNNSCYSGATLTCGAVRRVTDLTRQIAMITLTMIQTRPMHEPITAPRTGSDNSGDDERWLSLDVTTTAEHTNTHTDMYIDSLRTFYCLSGLHVDKDKILECVQSRLWRVLC